MARHRVLSSLLIAPIALISFAAPSIGHAQETGYAVTVYKATCTWTGSTPGVVIDNDAGTTATARDCVDGWTVDGVALSLNGEAPDVEDADAAVWTNIPEGASVVVASGNIPDESALTFQVAREDVTVWATFYNFERGDEPEGAGSTANPTTAADVTALPNTGSGNTLGSQSLLTTLLAAVSALIGAIGIAFGRKRLNQ